MVKVIGILTFETLPGLNRHRLNALTAELSRIGLPILWAMVAIRNHEKMKDLWPPKFEMPHGFWDTYHPGGEWGILYQVKWIEPNRKGELPFVKVIVRWNDVDFRTVFSSDDTVFLKGLYETLRTRGVGHSLEDVGNLVVDF